MRKTKEHPIPCASLSAVTFHSQTDDNEFKSKSMWNPDWTIQKEVSITIDQSTNQTNKICTKKTQILTGIMFIFGLILLIVILILIFTLNRNSTTQTSTTMISSSLASTSR